MASDCRKCKKYDACDDLEKCINAVVKRDMDRIESPRKQQINLIYMHDLTEYDNYQLDKLIYGDAEE